MKRGAMQTVDNSGCVLFRDGNHIEPPDESYWDTGGTLDNPYVPNSDAQRDGLPVAHFKPMPQDEWLHDPNELDEDDLPRERGTGNKLRDHVLTHGTGPRLPAINAPREYRTDANPYVHFDPEACVLCNLCVRYCDEVEAVSAITLAGRGAGTTIATADDRDLLDTTCELCGGCIAVCPTGAMTERAALDSDYRQEKVVPTTCNFCGVGCQLNLHVNDGKVVRVSSPEPGTTVNDGNLCVKGRFSTEFIHHPERLTKPLIRGSDGELHEASWDDAIAAVAAGLMGVAERHGADQLGFISSSRCTGEENYLVQKLSRAAFGTNNCHQCAAT